MGFAVSIVSAVIKSVVGDKLESRLIKELVGISIDGISEKSINEITDFINGAKSKIDSILSKENMKSMGISEDIIDYVVTEIKDLLSKVEITDEVLRQCKYDCMNLSAFLWNKYCECKNDYIEYEREIERCLFEVAEALIKLVRESENFESDVLIHISNSVDDVMIGLQKISEYMKENFGKLDDNSQIILNLLLSILEQIQKMKIQGNETKSTADEEKKFQNNKKQKYIENWNSRLFLHFNNEDNFISLADAFIMSNYKMKKTTKGIGFSENDSLDKIIEKFVNYGKTSTLLIVGIPGIGKSSIVSWMANEYCNDDRIIVLRFRDWEYEELENGILKAVYCMLECKKIDLYNKILVLDGFDEMKTLDIRNKLLNDFMFDIKDIKNFKSIITSRSPYISSNIFQNVIELQEFDIDQIDQFFQKITGSNLGNKEKIKSNLDVIGIPVILYMAIMSKIDICENPTKPELYRHIFAEEGGIFDKFFDGENEYSEGTQILRNPDNIKHYLKFLRDVAFVMFEKNKLSLKKDECYVPKLDFQGKSVSILEFPIKHLFDDMEVNVEFVHKTIYEYFVAESIFVSINNAIHMTTKEIAGVLGKLLIRNNLNTEILEFLKYMVASNMSEKYVLMEKVFQLMMKKGMTYYANVTYKSVLHSEMTIFQNMMKIVGLWEKATIKQDNMLLQYINLCKKV